MPRLFTYIIPIDDGAAPNPYWGTCTLNICKPGIRRVAKLGDWIAGFGSKDAPSGNLSGRLVYAMEVTDILSMQNYDLYTRRFLPDKIPTFAKPDVKSRLGDAIYDFYLSPPTQRKSVHLPSNQATDLSGKNCLLSNNFVYFGCNSIETPASLKPIIYQGRGHRSTKNDSYVMEFAEWIKTVIKSGASIRGTPDYPINWTVGCGSGCKSRQDEDDFEEDQP